MNPAVFLDRDGTLNIEKSYLCDPDKLELFEDALTSLKRLGEAGFCLFIVTNQSGIGRGYYTEADMHAVNEKLIQIAAEDGIEFKEIYFAPEAPDEVSYGRKPSPQFLLDAKKEHDIDLSKSFMIGDKLSDLKCGWNAGVKQSILVRTGYGAELAKQTEVDLSEAVVVASMTEATDYIVGGTSVPHSGRIRD
jgi:D-glycero-D-manno-heptose 1,7-bisphosphate phosphatase